MASLKILITAFAFEPSESSEPGVAWRFATLAAHNHEVHVLTGGFPGAVERTRLYLEAHPELQIKAIPFWPIGFPRVAGWKCINIHYWLWQRQIHRVATKLHAKIGFDLIHHVTLSRYWIGSSISRLPIPLIWGPVGSGGETPPSFIKELPLRDWIPDIARELSAKICRRDPLLRNTLNKAAICIAMNNDTAKRLTDEGVRRVEILPQICFSEERLKELAAIPLPPSETPFRLLSIGRLVYWKGFQYGIRTAYLLKQQGILFQYHITSWGPYEGSLRKLIATLGLQNEVFLVGRKTYEEIIHQELRQAHVLIHPALHESFGNVCLEALASGRPVICLNVGGPAFQVTNDCGYAVTIRNPKSAIKAMAAAIIDLINNPEKLHAMSIAAKKRARSQFHLNRLKEAMEQFYFQVAARIEN